MLNTIFSTLAPIVTIILIGYAFRKFISIDVRQLTDVSLYIFTSALVFYTILNTRIPTAKILIMGFAIVVLYSILAAFGLFVGIVKKYSSEYLSATLLCLLFVNSGNMGLPFNLFAYGQEGLEIASLYLVFNAIMTHSIGIFIAARGQRSNLNALAAVFKMPLIYAVFFAVLARALPVNRDNFIFTAIDLLQQAAVPFMLTILGIQIANTQITGNWGKINFVLGGRLFLSPVLALFISFIFGLDGLMQKVFIIQSAMPVAINSAILSIKFDAKPNFVANAVVLSTGVSIVSLALVFMLVEVFL